LAVAVVKQTDLWYRAMDKIRKETDGEGVAPSTKDLPAISRLYARFLKEGPRRGDGCFARDPVEGAIDHFHKMLPDTKNMKTGGWFDPTRPR
jgi:hypothetical protein